MSSRIFLVFALLALLGGSTSWAKKKHHDKSESADLTIEEISPASVTVDVGKDAQETYMFTSSTKATLDGAPVSVDDLKAGMVADFTLGADEKTVMNVAAKDPRRVTKKPVIHHDTTVWVMH